MIDFVVSRPEVVAAFLSALAAGFAAYTAWKGPLSAARLAEDLRRDGQEAEERRKAKLEIFVALMQERKSLWSPSGVRALNLIDVIFFDVREVRDAWADLYNSYDPSRHVPMHEQENRIRKMLEAMAKDLKFSKELRVDDFDRLYYPDFMAKRRELDMLQTDQTLRTLRGQSSPTANTAPTASASSLFPPPPP
ncbi:hypothetical protein GWK16_19595 [Roseomonas sp. JC162]|uniref:DUF6680 domain-containing protein n=1 Tax=Neoroseomonas marina TaxID=1232220 RepID=A0A848EG93_9PROT|nr:DUF6680 family protein [Neoroseomonas marina]NMJ43461.1 hypothetical protein [Neoroseomonas marina]